MCSRDSRWSSGKDPVLSLPRVWVGSLVGELRSHKPQGAAKKTKQKNVLDTRSGLSHVLQARDQQPLDKGPFLPAVLSLDPWGALRGGLHMGRWDNRGPVPLLPGAPGDAEGAAASEVPRPEACQAPPFHACSPPIWPPP